MPPVKNPCVMTSYGGIIRIRLKGRSSVTSSQPAIQAPLYLFLVLYTDSFQNATGRLVLIFLFHQSVFDFDAVEFFQHGFGGNEDEDHRCGGMD